MGPLGLPTIVVIPKWYGENRKSIFCHEAKVAIRLLTGEEYRSCSDISSLASRSGTLNRVTSAS